jgi:HEAT repeat protein
MLTPNVFALLPGRRPFSRYRRALHQQIHAEPALRLLPHLLDIPLGCAPLPDPEAILAGPAGIALLSPPAGGRTLALFQILAHWASGSSRVPAIFLALSECDSPNLSPRAIVTGALHRAGAGAPTLDQRRPALLLIDEWECLPANRRILWRQYLTGLAENWPAARAVVALPAGEAWPELLERTITPPDDGTLAIWLGRLLPNHDPAPLLAALSRAPLAALRTSLADLLLLVLVYPISGLPGSRAALYEQAYALVQPVLSEPPAAFRGAAAAEHPEAPPMSPAIGRAVLRHYRLARGLAGGADLVTLADLPARERAAVAPLAAGLLDDPTPVLNLLWGDHTPATIDLDALIACVCERPAAAPAHTLRLLELLAAPAAAPRPAAGAHLLPALLSAAAPADPARALAVFGALAAGPANDARWLELVDAPAAPPALRWAAAERLAGNPPPLAELCAVPPQPDPISLAGRAYLALHVAPLDGTALLNKPLRNGLDLLLAADADVQRRRTVAAALLASAQIPAELRRLALAATPAEGAEDRALIDGALLDPNATVRQAARTRLLARPPDEACAGLARALTTPDLDPPIAAELLDAAGHLDDPGVVKLLARCVATTGQRLPVRLAAVDRLAACGAVGNAALVGLLQAASLPAPVHAAVVRHVGARGHAAALPVVRALLLNDGPPLIRRAAAAALVEYARRPATHDGALAALLAVVRRPQLDREVTITALHGLAVAQPTLAVPAVAARLDPRYPQALARAWQQAAPELARTPATAWPGLPLPESLQCILADALAVGETPADPPTSLGELAASQALAEALAAVATLAAIAGREPALAGEIQARLRRALAAPERPGLPEAILTALAHLPCTSAQAELVHLLDAPNVSLSLRWRAIDALGRAPGVAALAVSRLQRGCDDPFTQSKLVELLGEQSPPGALSVLRQIAEDPAGPDHLRRAALQSMSGLDDPAAVGALVRIVVDEARPELRAAAAVALPAGLAAVHCRTLRDRLRSERHPEVLAAILAALGRTADREALPLLLRYTQSEQSAVALAAIEGVAALGDDSLAPPLVRVSQNTLAAPHVRLAAVCALVRLCGAEFAPLLRDYLASPQLALRLRAHTVLAAHDRDDPRLLEPIADPAAPLALRQEALVRLAGYAPEASLIGQLVCHPDETPHIRLLAVAALARRGAAEDVEALRATLAAPAMPLLHRRCIEALTAIAQSAAPAAHAAQIQLETYALSPDAPPTFRHWAGAGLLDAARRR